VEGDIGLTQARAVLEHPLYLRIERHLRGCTRKSAALKSASGHLSQPLLRLRVGAMVAFEATAQRTAVVHGCAHPRRDPPSSARTLARKSLTLTESAMHVLDQRAGGDEKLARSRLAASALCLALVGIWLCGCSAYDSALLKRHERPAVVKVDAGSHRIDSGVPTSCDGLADLSICERPNADGVCLDGKCSIVRCHAGFSDCDMDAATGCEATLDSVEHCGACGASCALSHVAHARCEPKATGGPCLIDHGCAPDANAGCVQGAAETGCEAGFGDCDDISSNGCETSLRTLSNCASCGKACAIQGSEASCASGKCAFVGCETGFDDCGGGCASLAGDPAHCGACNTACSSSSPMCAGGRCTSAECGTGRADCDDNVANGCEADLTSAGTCGSCNVSCGPYAQALAGCADGKCVVSSCKPGFADCDKARDTGCETDLSQPGNCGSCGHDCGMLSHVAGAGCANGECANLTCEAGWGNCDGNAENGCEQPLNTVDHCESCTGTCNPANATGTCATGHCAISACAETFDDCNKKVEDGCEAALGGDSNCGMCGNSCPTGTKCSNGGCSCTSGACANGTTCCSGACVDTNTTCFPWPCIPGTSRDKNNCGGCGVACLGWCCA
jgi:hypothetical protein